MIRGYCLWVANALLCILIVLATGLQAQQNPKKAGKARAKPVATPKENVRDARNMPTGRAQQPRDPEYARYGIYEQTEAIPGVAVRLLVGSTGSSYYDISSAVGSFAIPIQSIAAGATVQVVVSNTSSTNLALSIPQDYRNFSTTSLAPGESRLYGTFVRPATTGNVGLRNVTPVAALVAPVLTIFPAGASIRLGWSSALGLEYQPQWTTDFISWNGLTNTFLPGTGSNLTYLDSATSPAAKFYRLLVRKP